MGLENTGQSIAHLRKKAGLTQRELADYLGISDKAVSKWERGITFPDISFLQQLSIILDTDADSLLAGAIAHNEAWTGILLLNEHSENDSPHIDTIIYDKPMICYLLSCFMLAGIRSIHVLCSEKERAFISEKFGDGRELGLSLEYSASISSAPKNTGIMLVAGKSLLYGRGLTRCFNLAMTRKNQVTVLSLMKKDDDTSRLIDFTPTMLVTRIGRRPHKRNTYAHYYIPFLFIPKDMLNFHFPQNIRDFDSTLLELASRKMLYTEILDRGFLEFRLNTWEEVSDASVFVKLAQRTSGMLLCSLEEIARRRGFIQEEK